MSDHPNAAPDAAAEEAQAQADFDSGAAMETGRPAAKAPEAKPEKPEGQKPSAPAAKPPAKKPEAAPATPTPRYVQLTEEQFARLNAAADKTATYDQQLSRAFGTIGDLQKLVKNLQGQTPRGLKVEIPKDAFAGMAKDFPELAEHFRTTLEAALKGITGSAAADAPAPDPEEMRRTVAERVRAVQVEALEEEYPDWRTIVGAVDATTHQPDPNNAFRKWLATKSPTYQARINGTNSAAVIAKAIGSFQRETTAPPTPAAPAAKPVDPKVQARQERIRAAIQPRGDGAQPPAGNSDEDEFEAGFKTG